MTSFKYQIHYKLFSGLMRNNKGVSTLGEFIIIIGVIIVSAIFLLSFQRTITQETGTAKKMSVKEIGERISSLMQRVDSEPSWTVYEIKIPYSTVEVKNGVLTIKSDGEVFSESVPENSKDILLEDILKLAIMKQNDKIILAKKPPVCNMNFFCEPKECFYDCQDCYGPSPTCIGDGNCTKAIGEHCENSPDDCACGSGKVCCPTHPDSDEMSCLILNQTRSKGEQCYCDNECSGDLKCNPTTPKFNDFEKACCPKGKRWNGNKCKKIKVYDIVFVPLYYDSGEFQQFKSDAQKSFDYFVSKSSFKECPDPKSRVKMHLIKPEKCQKSCSHICYDCQSAGKDCVLNDPELKNKWDKIAILCKGKSCSGACGCAAGIPAPTSVSNMARCRVPGYQVPTHEMGHSFGLYHVKGCGAAGACQGCNAQDCNEPDTASMVMDYCNGMNRYGPHGYSCLKTNVFKDYLVGC